MIKENKIPTVRIPFFFFNYLFVCNILIRKQKNYNEKITFFFSFTKLRLFFFNFCFLSKIEDLSPRTTCERN